MSTLAEKLAALRAGANAQPKQEEQTQTVEVKKDEQPSASNSVQRDEVPAVESTSRELSLAEKIAALKTGSSKSNINVPVPSNVATSNIGGNSSSSLSALSKALRVAPTLPEEVNEKAPASLHSLRDRIWKLQETTDGMNLKDEMKKLQTALIENADAVSYFLPEDYGEMVLNIRRMVGNAVAANLGKPATRGKKASGSVAAQSEQISLDELSF